jgi:cell wall-associated NlpC family hydrolase
VGSNPTPSVFATLTASVRGHPIVATNRQGSKLALIATLAIAAALGGAGGASAAQLPMGEVDCIPRVFSAKLTSETCESDLVRGRAVAPSYAPAPVKAVIAAANRIAHQPYVWGGGHLGWRSRGYDCSGAVSYALHGADMLDVPMVSGQLEDWGVGGVGRWISVYARATHVYMVIAGLRYDTRDDPPGVSGPRWHREMVAPNGFVVRHPDGL